jgi:hypothetical protein
MLRSNFQEIYHAVKYSESQGICLAANMSGTRIYDSTRGWGRLWRWFYSFIDLLTFHNYRLAKLKQAILYTHRIFQEHLFSLKQHLSCYETYLKKLGSGYVVDEEPVHIARKGIRLWNQSTMPFINLMRECQHPKLNHLFRLCFGAQVELSTLWDHPDVAVTEAAGKMIDIEGLSQGPLPLEAFKKILRNKPLNSLDQKELNKWIARINQVPNCVDKVHAALNFISDCYHKGDDNKTNMDVVRLEIFLEDRGCKIFKQCDKQQMHWRTSLKKGMTLTQGDQRWILYSQFPSTKIAEDDTLVFAIDNDAKVIIIPKNKVVLSMRQFRQRHSNSLDITPACLDICANGSWALMERLQPLESRQWQSLPEQAILHTDDRQLVKELSLFIEKCVKKQETPVNFNVASLMYDQHYHLKALNMEIKRATECRAPSFDFNALEDFAFACAANNRVVFKHLMIDSGLSAHPIGMFYHELIINALNGDQTSIEDMAGIYKITDPQAVDRGLEVVKEMLALRDQCSLKMRQCYPDMNLKTIMSDVNAKLIKAHKESGACGRTILTHKQWLDALHL